MSDSLVTALVSIVLAIISLAALNTILSPKAKTSQVIGAASQGLGQNILAAVSPVTGSMPSFNNYGSGF